MKIDSLTIQNFKCFKAEKTFDFGRITILTGANSSGKSSVMYAILAALQSDNFPYNFSLNGNFINLGDFKEISNGHRNGNVIKLELGFKRFFLTTHWIEDEVSFLPKLKSNSIRHNPPPIEMFFFPFPFANEDLEDIVERVNYLGAFRQPPSRTYLEKNKGNYKVDTEGGGYLDQIVEWEKRGNGKIKALVELMKDMELIEDIKINRLGGGRFEVLVKAFKNSLLTPLSNVGFGVSQFLPIMVADLQLPDDSTLFLAEPEIHLHPSVQSKFGDYIVNQVNKTQKNYVIETHSEYFLNKIRLAIVKGELKKEDIKIYFLENKDDDTEVFDIDFKKNGAIKNAPKTFFETYSIDVMDIALNAFAE